jgi:hypothetical protein
VLVIQAACQVGAGDDVAPLVGATNLQLAAVALVQLGEVVALQQAVGELGVGDALVFTLEALLYGFLLDHGIDREVLADVAHELKCAHAAEPVVVVGHDSCIGPSNRRNGTTWPRILSTQLAMTSGVLSLRSVALKLGSPIMPVAPPTSAMGLWPASWKRLRISTGTRWPRCRLSAVGSKPQYSVTDSFGQQLIERLRVGDLGDQAAILQILDEGGLVHCVFSTRQAPGAPKFQLLILAEPTADRTLPRAFRARPISPLENEMPRARL